MKKGLLLTLVFIVFLYIAGCSSSTNEAGGTKKDSKVTIGVSLQNLSNPFFVAMSNGAKEGAKEHGADVIVVGADDDIAKQTSQIEDLIAKKVSMIILAPVDSKGIAGAVAEAKSAGIPVISVDSGADGGVDSVVTSDNVLAGKLAGEYIIKQLNGKGNVVVLGAVPNTAVDDRLAGFKEAIKDESGIKIVATQNGKGTREGSVTVMETILQANPSGKIDAVFAINDPSAIGAQIAAEQANRDSEMFFVGVDGSPDGEKALKEKKKFYATSAQHPFDMVKTGIDTGFKVIDGEKVDKLIKVPVDLITQDDIDSYKGW
ncbi:substrate-binding domain-containing protein [Neobacillus sp. Marseille-QA0830]